MANKTVWLVIQHQFDSEEYDNSTVDVFETEADATACARALNQLYGTTSSIEFTPNWDFYDITDYSAENCHYYTISSRTIYTWPEYKQRMGY